MEKDSEEDSRKNIEILKDLQQSEAGLHWQRNGFFLVASSILLVAVGQFHTNIIGLSFGILGLMMNSVWLLIQYRSSEYIKKWKAKEKAEEKKLKYPPDLYSGEVRGYEMRKLAMLLPTPFIMIWGVVFIISIYDILTHANMFAASTLSLNSTMP